LNKAQQAMAEKLAAMETVFVNRRVALEEDFRKRQAELESHITLRETEQREAWIRKESELHEKYQSLIKEEQARMQTQLEAQKKKLEDDYTKRADSLEQRHQLVEREFNQAKAAWEEAVHRKENTSAGQWTLRERQLSDQYQHALAEERSKAETELHKGTEELAEQKKFWDKDLKGKEQLLEAQYKQRQRDLELEWKRKETEIRNQIELEAQTRAAAFEGNTLRPLVADCRRCLQNLEWRLLIFRLRRRSQVWPKNNRRPSPFNRC